MRQVLVLLVALWGTGCRSTPSASGLEGRGGDVAAHPPPPAVSRLELAIVPPRVASVVYALERVAARGGGDARYRTWLSAPGETSAPAWLEAYTALRGRDRRSVDRGDGPYDPHAACGYDAESSAAVIGCWSELLAADELEVAARALREADARLDAHWQRLAPALATAQRELHRIAHSEAGHALAEQLAELAQLPADARLVFQVVLVAKPPGGPYRASQAGRSLVLEVDAERPAAERAPVMFHELAHLVSRHAPGLAALERAFEGRGQAGLVAASLWGEAFATAYGNGLAAARLGRVHELGGSASTQRAWYDDEAIDALGRALYPRLRDGPPLRLDATLGAELLRLLPEAWPRERWRPRDAFGKVHVLAEDRATSSAFERELRPAQLARDVPLPKDLERRLAEPAPLPRVLLATLDTLRARPGLARALGLEPSELVGRVTTEGPSVYFRERESGAPLVLVSAATPDALAAAARAFATTTPLAPPGWSTLEVAR